MAKTWFLSDPHFGHKNIIRLAKRPFESVEEMDAHLVTACQSVVAADDELWCLGDFSFYTGARLRALFASMPGNRFLIRGNHDSSEVTSLPWLRQYDLATIERKGVRFEIAHYPMLSWNGMHKGVVHLHGHTHSDRVHTSGIEADPFPQHRVNMCVEAWNYKPVSDDQLVAMLAAQKAQSLPVRP